ncbi:MAG: hypothetical protein ACOX26_03785 [Bacilli bacterium]
MRNRSGLIASVVITIVLVVLLNLCTFVIPFEKLSTAVLVVAYIMAEIVIIAAGILVASQLFNEPDRNQKVLGLPIVFSGYIALGIQLLATTIFYIVNSFIEMPVWIVVIVEAFIIAYLVIQTAKGFFFKRRVVEYQEHAANTKFMDEFRARLKAIVAINNNENIEKELRALLDLALGSDPVTNDKTLDSESELLSCLQELDEAVKSGSEEDSRAVITKTKNALLERNVLCKAGK